MATEVAVQVHDTLPQGIKSVRGLLQKKKYLQHAQLQETSVEKA